MENGHSATGYNYNWKDTGSSAEVATLKALGHSRKEPWAGIYGKPKVRRDGTSSTIVLPAAAQQRESGESKLKLGKYIQDMHSRQALLRPSEYLDPHPLAESTSDSKWYYK